MLTTAKVRRNAGGPLDGASVERWGRFGEVWSHFWTFMAALPPVRRLRRHGSNKLGAFHAPHVGAIHDQWVKVICVFQQAIVFFNEQ